MRSLVLAALVALSPFARAAEKPLLVDGTAASVGKNMVTVQDAYFYRAVQRFRDGEGDPLELEEGEALRRTVQKLVFEDMVQSEMASFKFDGGSRAEAEKIVRARKLKAKPQVWHELTTRFGRGEGAVVDCILRSLQVERFIQKKVETLTPIITQAEVERYYTSNKARFQGSDFESLKPKIILLLKKERMQKGLEEWVRFLRDKYGVTNHLAAG